MRELIMIMEKNGIKISPTYINKIEKHSEIPAPDVLAQLARDLELDGKEFFKIATQEKIDQLTRKVKDLYVWEVYR